MEAWGIKSYSREEKYVRDGLVRGREGRKRVG